jgi:hypothetical protein
MYTVNKRLVGCQAAIAGKPAPTGIKGWAKLFSRHKKGDPKVALVPYCPNCRPNPPGTP